MADLLKFPAARPFGGGRAATSADVPEVGIAAPLSTRPLNEREIAYLRDVMEPVRTEVELWKLRAERYRLRLEANPPLPLWQAAVMMLVAVLIGVMLAKGGAL
jgi:hypothetical protein